MAIDKNNFFVKSQIETSIGHIERLLRTGVFGASVLGPFQEPVFVSVILKMNDLLQKFTALGERINFTDDIPSGDVTDLVSKIRNAICHLDSPENLLDKGSQIKFVFNMAVGKVNMMEINGRKVNSDYGDDVAFFFGEYRIYLKRHLIRVLRESRGKFKKLYPAN